MSGQGAPQLSTTRARELTVGIVLTEWHRDILDALEAGALRALADAGTTHSTIVRVPGAFELPVAAQALAAKYDVVAAFGAVIRGETPHFDYVCSAATDGLLRVSLDSGKPVGFGLLTCETVAQAWDRAGVEGSSEDKGYEVTMAALMTAVALSDI